MADFAYFTQCTFVQALLAIVFTVVIFIKLDTMVAFLPIQVHRSHFRPLVPRPPHRRPVHPWQPEVTQSGPHSFKNGLKAAEQNEIVIPDRGTEGGLIASRFMEALPKLKVETHKVGISNFNGVRGVVATEQLQPKELLIAVPFESTIFATSNEGNSLPAVADSFWNAADWDVRLALKLLSERAAPRPGYDAYFSLLPEKFTSLVEWDDAQLRALQYPPLQRSVKEQKEQWHQIYDALHASSPQFKVTWEDFLWAMCAVRSRSLRGVVPSEVIRAASIAGALVIASVIALQMGNGPLALSLTALAATFTLLNRESLLYGARGDKYHFILPMIDLVNHGSGTPTDITFSIWKWQVEFRAAQVIPRGGQVLISYVRTNDDLLQYFGFVEVDNLQDTYQLDNALEFFKSLQDICPSADELRQGVNAIEAAGLLPYINTITVLRDTIAPSSHQAMELLFSHVEETNGERTRAILDAVRRLALDTQSKWLTTLEDDMKMLPLATSEEDGLALQFRIEKKKVLQSFLRAVDSRLPSRGQSKSVALS